MYNVRHARNNTPRGSVGVVSITLDSHARGPKKKKKINNDFLVRAYGVRTINVCTTAIMRRASVCVPIRSTKKGPDVRVAKSVYNYTRTQVYVHSHSCSLPDNLYTRTYT